MAIEEQASKAAEAEAYWREHLQGYGDMLAILQRFKRENDNKIAEMQISLGYRRGFCGLTGRE